MSELLHDPEFWVLVAFIITVAILWKPVKKPLIAGLDGRIARQRGEIDEAQRLRDEAQQLLATYQLKQRDALAEAEEIIGRARAEAERHRVSAHEELETAIRRRRQQALEKIAQAEAQALAEVRNAAVEAAVAATRTIIAHQLDTAHADGLIDQAIQDLPQRLH